MADRWRLSAFGDEIAFDLEDQISALRTNDIRGLELRSAWGTNVVDLEADQRDRAHRLLTEAGIAVSAIGSPVGKIAIDGDFDSELARLRAALTAAKQLEATKVRIFSFFVPDGRHAEYRDEVMRRMSAFAREAQAQGIALVHENESYIYGDDAEHCRDIVESVGSAALQIAFDPANFVQAGVKPYDEAWPRLAANVTHFHVKDAVAVNRMGSGPHPAHVSELELMASVRPAGEGEGQLEELLRALEREGYSGYLVIEPHLQLRLPEMSATERFAVALEALRGLLTRSGSSRKG